jgi:hypothetical protein
VVAVCGCGRAAHSIRAGAHARAVAGSQWFQETGFLAADGNPEPAAGSFPDGAERALHYSLCAPSGGKCRPLAWTEKRRTAGPQPGPQPAGTVFKLTARWDKHTYSSSLRWGGALRVTRPPTLAGAMHVGATVRVDGARWSGGWRAASDGLGIEACRTVRATGCVMLSGEYLQCGPAGCGVLGGVPGTVVAADHAQVGAWYTGWYLFALDARLSAFELNGDVGFAQAAIPPWPTIRTIARSRPYGPVIGPPAPTVVILPHARVQAGHVLVATVHCAVPCRAAIWLEAKHANAQDRIGWTAKELIKGTKRVGVTGTVPSGRANVSVEVGNGPYVKGHTSVR